MNANDFEKNFQEGSQALVGWGETHRNAVRVLGGILLGLVIGFMLFH